MGGQKNSLILGGESSPKNLFLGAYQEFKLLNIKSLEEDNKHLKHVPSTCEDQKELFLIEIKPLRPSFKIKFIEIHSKEVSQSIQSIFTLVGLSSLIGD